MLKLNGIPVNSIETTDYIKKLPSIYSILFPKGYEILPNTTELFELEFAFYEQSIISKEEIIRKRN